MVATVAMCHRCHYYGATMMPPYIYDADKGTIVTATVTATEGMLYVGTHGQPVAYETAIRDLCLCMVYAIDHDDATGKTAMTYLLRTIYAEMVAQGLLD